MSVKRICILLAAYNGSEYLNEQLESIFRQTTDCDIYISVDKCSDDTLLIAEKNASENINVFVLPYGKRYGSAGQNFFTLLLDVDFSSYDYIAFSDQDDVWFDNKLERAIKKINDNNADGYSSNVMAFWENGKQKLVKKSYPQSEFDYIFESAGPGCTFVIRQVLALAIKRSLVDKKDDVAKLWLHDWYCYAFARHKGFRWIIDEEPTMAYRQHSGNEVGANSGWKSFKSRAKSILSGVGIAKALEQARFLGATTSKPVSLLCSGKRLDLLKLAFLARSCRRNPVDKTLFFMIFIWFSIKGLALDES